jgi:hypothetical protein
MHGSALRRLLVACALVVLGGALMTLTVCGSGIPAGPVDPEKAMAHVRQLVACNPRPAGSPGLAKAADYIAGQLKALGLNPQRDEFEHPQEKITIRNVWAPSTRIGPECHRRRRRAGGAAGDGARVHQGSQVQAEGERVAAVHRR